MKFIFVATALMLCAVVGLGQKKPEKGKIPSDKGSIRVCDANTDALYNRHAVLNQFAAMLNAAAPGYREYEKRGFYVENERPRKFFVYDLTDPSNKGMPLGDCVKLISDHVYHVAPIYSPFSLSHIVILENGTQKVFRSINCKNSKDGLDDVIGYLIQKLKNDRNKDEIISRVQNYREYGEYFTIDDQSLHCE